MDGNKEINISLKDVYQMLITGCRYSYSRNNHLTPDDAFERCKDLLPKMHKIDAEYAIHTAKQLCEEAISDQLIMHFGDGIDDEFHNRAKTIVFIVWLKSFIWQDDPNYLPYNENALQENLKHDQDKIYYLYEIIGDRYCPLNHGNPLSVTDYPNFIFNLITDKQQTAMYYTAETTEIGFIYHTTSPVKRNILVTRFPEKVEI